jgi:hypothetical protein
MVIDNSWRRTDGGKTTSWMMQIQKLYIFVNTHYIQRNKESRHSITALDAPKSLSSRC